ncbi:MAG TPA: hypothetical protein VJY85_11815, partial [Candidatus Limnocylindria bacterium]|nr:hypothetical protein [Candidatus Limnocylindria bacterium]
AGFGGAQAGAVPTEGPAGGSAGAGTGSALAIPAIANGPMKRPPATAAPTIIFFTFITRSSF